MNITKLSRIKINTYDGRYSINFSNGDFNGDGLMDFIIASMSYPTSQDLNAISNNPPHLLIQQQNGTFIDDTNNIIPIVADVNQIDNIITADINNDGITDIFISNGGSDAPNGSRGDTNKIYISSNNKLILSQFPKDYNSFFHYVNLGDINNDGLLDAFFTSAYTQVSSLFLLNKDNQLIESNNLLPSGLKNNVNLWEMNKVSGTENDYIQPHHTFMSSQLIDINRDGFLDLLMFPHTGDSEFFFINDGKGNFSKSVAQAIKVSFAGSNPAYEYSTWKNINQKWIEQSTFSSNYMFYDSVIFDVNNDGWDDVIGIGTYDKSSYNYITNESTNEIFHQGTYLQILINNGNGLTDETTQRISQPSLIKKDYAYYPYMRAIDLNNDGFKDLMFTRTTDVNPDSNSSDWMGENITRFYLNNGKGVFSEYKFDNLMNNNYYPTIIDGKLAFIGISLYEEKLTNNVIVDAWKTDVPWTVGGNGNDFLYPSVINETIDGQEGIDTFVVGKRHEYCKLTIQSNKISISNIGGVDQLISIERIKFNDSFLAIDLSGNAGTTAKILGSVFGKDSISNKNYVGIGLHFLDSGWTYDNLAGLALDAAGAKTNDQIVSLLWTNVIGTKPTAADKQPFITLLENGMSAGALAHLAADSSFNTTNINLVGLAQTGIEYIPVS